jgi:hypothetical protein
LTRSLNASRILDLVFITKNTDSVVETVDSEHHDAVALFHALDCEAGGFISDDDIPYAADELEPSSSAALLIGQDLWGDAVRRGASGVRRGAARGTADPSRPDRSRTRRRPSPSTPRKRRA